MAHIFMCVYLSLRILLWTMCTAMCTAPMGANVNYAMDYIIAQCLSSRHCTIMGANVEQRQDTYKTRTRYKATYYEIPTKLKNK